MRRFASPTYGSILALFCGTLALAHAGATGVVKERMQGMKSMSDAVKALGALKAGVIPFSADTMHLAATQILQHGIAAKDLFPSGSLLSPSEALPVIWDEKAAFDTIFDEMVTAAEALKQVDTREDAAPLMTRIGDQCKECHWRYRIKK